MAKALNLHWYYNRIHNFSVRVHQFIMRSMLLSDRFRVPIHSRIHRVVPLTFNTFNHRTLKILPLSLLLYWPLLRFSIIIRERVLFIYSYIIMHVCIDIIILTFIYLYETSFTGSFIRAHQSQWSFICLSLFYYYYLSLLLHVLRNYMRWPQIAFHSEVILVKMYIFQYECKGTENYILIDKISRTLTLQNNCSMIFLISHVEHINISHLVWIYFQKLFRIVGIASYNYKEILSCVSMYRTREKL